MYFGRQRTLYNYRNIQFWKFIFLKKFFKSSCCYVAVGICRICYAVSYFYLPLISRTYIVGATCFNSFFIFFFSSSYFSSSAHFSSRETGWCHLLWVVMAPTASWVVTSVQNGAWLIFYWGDAVYSDHHGLDRSFSHTWLGMCGGQLSKVDIWHLVIITVRSFCQEGCVMGYCEAIVLW